MMKTIFKINELVAVLHVFFNAVVRQTALSRKLSLNVEDFYVNTFLRQL